MLALQLAIDTTPFGSPHERPAYTRQYKPTAFVKPESRMPYVDQPGEDDDRPFTVIAFSKELTRPRRHDTTPLASELQGRAGSTQSISESQTASPVDAARDARIALLIRKYEERSSKEDSARLQILTHRLRRLSPRVTSEDIESLSAVVAQMEEVSKSIEAMRAKLSTE